MCARMHACTCSVRTLLVAVVVLDHVLEDEVAVEFVWVVVLVPTTAVLVGPLDHQLRILALLLSTLEVFLQHNENTPN